MRSEFDDAEATMAELVAHTRTTTLLQEYAPTITLLSATTFVSEVDSATLSLMVPLLARGLNEKPTATKRKVAV